jgi:hypothetical protein
VDRLKGPALKPEISNALRLGGPVIEVVCLALLFATRGRRIEIAGLLPLEYLLYAGFALGLVMVLAGVALARTTSRRPRDD